VREYRVDVRSPLLAAEARNSGHSGGDAGLFKFTDHLEQEEWDYAGS
jgi:hypothetical protein